MRILNWMQNKLNGGHGNKKSTAALPSNFHPKKEACRAEEFSDWPNGLFAIGTFGSHQLQEDLNRHDSSEKPHSPQSLSDSIEEEMSKLEKELRKLLVDKPTLSATESGGENDDLPLNKFLNSPSNLEVDSTDCEKHCDDLDDEDGEGDPSINTSVILSKAREICADNSNRIRQRSITFLLKKMFICHGEFTPAPSLRDPIPESRIEKFLRTILKKKIYPQNSASSSAKKYLVNKLTSQIEDKDQTEKKANDGSKWVKTDSDFIVLEM